MQTYIIKYNGQTIETLPVSEISPAEIKRQVVQVWPELENAEMLFSSSRIITFNLPRGTKQ